MTKSEIMTGISRKFNLAGLKLKKHSPEILLVTGVTGIIASAVMACKATTKVNAILEEAKETIDAVHDVMENHKDSEEYSEKDGQKALTMVYAQTGLELVKLYGPSVALGTASLVCILASNGIMRKRNAALAAAYATVDHSFKEYRGRIIERFGKELDREIKYNIKTQEIEERVVDNDGNETVVTKTVEVVDPNLYSDYARIYDDGCKGWEKNAEMNLVFLKQQQSYANRKLQTQGYLFLNEVYDMLGFPRTAAGQVVGWVYDEDHPIGDNFVDFGMYDVYNAKARDFVNGRERVIVLDFNVDGNILEYI